MLNTRSTILTDDEYEEDSIGIDEYDLNEVDNINTEIMDYISSSPIKAIRNSFSGGDGKSMAEIVAVAKFDSDEIAFFTKNYKAYVLDEADNSVKEVVASDLSEGDVIVFTRSTSKTRDIVEEILRDMINNKLVPPEIEKAYYKSREWKKTLIDYMKQTGSSAKAIIAGYKRNVPKELLPMLIQSTIRDYAKKIAIEKGITTEKVQPILERKWIVPTGEDEYLTTSVKYRAEEYEALSGEVSMSTDDYGDFLREGTEISNYAIPFIKSISLIHKVREVQALVGFSRLKPVDANMGESSSEYVVPVKQQDTNWYPAYEVRGEGIFIEFDENAISEWQKDNPEIQHRVDVLNENYRKSFIGQSKPRKVTAKFLLLHTISHTLIKQLSFECGYSIASLKERLYCSEISEGKQMSGIFIYTASGDSEGTMGGLVRQGCADTFPGIFKKAMEEAMTCSNDPVCSLSMGQGRDSLNLSACYSCCLIPETSCEEFNIFLDRGTIVGTYENREMGFYSRQLYGTASWKDNSISKVTTDVSLKSSVHVIVTDYGTDLRDSVYAEIWNSLRTWAVDTKEKVLLSELESNSDLFSQKEKPYRDCMFQVGGNEEMQKCDLFWKESQVALFTSDNEECYAAAKNSDIRCIYCADDTVTVRKILDVLKEQ